MKQKSKLFTNFFDALKAASMAHARWEYEVSTNILRSKKRLLILGILLLPCVVFAVAYASDHLPVILGGKKLIARAFPLLKYYGCQPW